MAHFIKTHVDDKEHLKDPSPACFIFQQSVQPIHGVELSWCFYGHLTLKVISGMVS